MHLRFLAPAALLLATACSSTTVVDGASACDGAIGVAPTVVAGGLDDAVDLVDVGDELLLTTSSVVSRVDPCTGAATVIANDEDIVASAVAGDDVYFVTTDIMGVLSWLHRVPLAGGEVEDLGDIETRRIAGATQGLYALASDEGAYRIIDVTDGPGGTQLELDGADYGRRYALHGATEAGLFLRDSYDAGGPLPMRRWAYGAEKTAAVPGSEGAIFVDVDPAGFTIYRESSATGGGIIRLPHGGGEPEVILEGAALRGQGEVRVLAGSRDAVCWRGLDTGPRCLSLGRATEPRVVDDTRAGPMVLRDALFWLREGSAGTELMAAVP